MELSNIQNTILEATESIVFVSSSAGSGKTKVLTEKVRQSIQKRKTVVAFTFTNMAAGEMKKRLQIDNSDEVFIGTIHSYCAHLLLRNGVKEAIKYMNDEKFDDLFHLMQEHPEYTPNIDICLCDEAQDSNEIQLKFIFDMLHAKEYFIVFDLRQSIYGFAGSRPDLLKRYQYELGAKVYSMNENYRCCPEVLRFAKSTLQKCNMNDDSVPMSNTHGTVATKPYSEKLILDMINISKKYYKWAVLARTNAQVDEIKEYLTKNGIPCDTFKQGDLKKEELDKKMGENTVKILTVHSAKGLEWDFVACVGLNLWSPEECRVSYVGITRARNGVLWLNRAKKQKTKTVSWE